MLTLLYPAKLGYILIRLLGILISAAFNYLQLKWCSWADMVDEAKNKK